MSGGYLLQDEYISKKIRDIRRKSRIEIGIYLSYGLLYYMENYTLWTIQILFKLRQRLTAWENEKRCGPAVLLYARVVERLYLDEAGCDSKRPAG